MIKIKMPEISRKLKLSVLFSIYLSLLFLLVIFTDKLDGIKGDNIYVAVTVLEFTVFLLPSVIFLKLRDFSYTDRLSLHIPEIDKLPTILAMLILMISANILLGFIIPSGNAAIEGEATPSGATDVIGSLISLAIVPAICEEFAFRGVILRESGKCGTVMSVLLSSLLFAMLHFDKSGFIAYLINGMLLALTVYITRNLLCAIILHTLYNTYSLFLESYFWNAVSHNVNVIIILSIIIAILLIALILVFAEGRRLYAYYDNIGLKAPYGEESDDTKKVPKTVRCLEFLECTLPCIIIYIVYNLVKA